MKPEIVIRGISATKCRIEIARIRAQNFQLMRKVMTSDDKERDAMQKQIDDNLERFNIIEAKYFGEMK